MTRALLCLIVATSWIAPAHATELPTVIVISLDGVRHDQLAEGSLPALARMARHGARAKGLTPPFPSNTFPSHATLRPPRHA